MAAVTEEEIGRSLVKGIEYLAGFIHEGPATFTVTSERPADPEDGPIAYRASVIVNGTEVLPQGFTYGELDDLVADVYDRFRSKYDEQMEPEDDDDDDD